MLATTNTVMSLGLVAVLGFAGGVGCSRSAEERTAASSPSTRANASSGQIEKPFEAAPESEASGLIIEVDSQGRIEIQGREESLETLAAIVKRECPTGEPVRIRTTVDSTWHVMEPIFKACMNNGASKIVVSLASE